MIRNRKFFLISLAVFALVISAAPLRADTIVLKSGTVIEGEIVEKTEQLVAIELDSGGTGFFSMEDIKSINELRQDVARGRIVEVTGDIEVLVRGETEWRPAEEGTPLDEGYSIRSGPDSTAVAIFAEKVIMAVEQDTEVDLEKLQKSRRTGMNIKVDLNQGQIWNDVGKLKSKRSKFYVETPQAITGVRGTIFTVQISPDDKTLVGVIKGNVDVRTRGMMVMPTAVGENSMTEVAASERPTQPTTLSENYLAQWDSYKGRFQRLRLQMAAQGIGDLPTPVIIAIVAAIGILIIFLMSRVLRRRKA